MRKRRWGAVIGLAMALSGANAVASPHAEPRVATTPVEETADPGLIPPRPFRQEVHHIAVEPGGPRLVVTILTPDAPGPYPIAVLNHGANGSARPADQPRHWKSFASYYFLSRGYAVVLPMARGFGGSEGELRIGRCRADDLGQGIAEDIAAVLREIARDPRFDAKRIVAAGQSFGGWNALAMGSEHIPGVKAVVNFNGGVSMSRCGDLRGSLAQGAAAYARTTTAPSIWFYGENDGIFPVKVWRAMYDAYEAQGGHAELIDVGRVHDNSHQFLNYSGTIPLWAPKVDALLEQAGLPHSAVYPEYLPVASPVPSNFAAIDDAAKLPYRTPALDALYAKFLAHPSPRVIAINAKGGAATQYGGFDPVTAALAACAQSGRACRPYAIDDDIVWRPIPPPPPASGYAAIGDVTKIPYLRAKAAPLIVRVLARPSPRALVIAPDGYFYGAFGLHAFEQAWLNCLAASRGCEPYLVDDAVVWRKGGTPELAADQAAQPFTHLALGGGSGGRVLGNRIIMVNQAVVSSLGALPKSVDEAKQRGDKAVAAAAMVGVFANITQDRVTRLQHVASGLICPNPSAIVVSPPLAFSALGPARRAMCVERAGDFEVDVIVTANGAGISPAQALAGLVEKTRADDTGLAPITSSSGLNADLEGVSLAAKDDGRVRVHIAVSIVNGWILATRARGATERALDVDRAGDVVLARLLPTITRSASS